MIGIGQNSDKRKTAYQITLILMAVYFSLVEGIIPKPFPWMKLGLANISTILGMKRYGVQFGIEILILRILIFSIMMGTFLTPGFIISFSSGLVSAIFMGVIFKKNIFSISAISSGAGFIHNLVQLLVVYILLFKNIDIMERGILVFILVFLLFGGISGFIVGGITDIVEADNKIKSNIFLDKFRKIK